jgi:NADPH2:quinone reductase
MDGRLIQVGTMHGAKVEGFDPAAVMRGRLILTGSTMRPRTTAGKGGLPRRS